MDFLTVVLASAFVVSAIDRWIDLRALRAAVAVTVPVILVVTNPPAEGVHVTAVLQFSLGAAFAALSAIEILSNLSSKTVIVKGRR